MDGPGLYFDITKKTGLRQPGLTLYKQVKGPVEVQVNLLN